MTTLLSSLRPLTRWVIKAGVIYCIIGLLPTSACLYTLAGQQFIINHLVETFDHVLYIFDEQKLRDFFTSSTAHFLKSSLDDSFIITVNPGVIITKMLCQKVASKHSEAYICQGMLLALHKLYKIIKCKLPGLVPLRLRCVRTRQWAPPCCLSRRRTPTTALMGR